MECLRKDSGNYILGRKTARRKLDSGRNMKDRRFVECLQSKTAAIYFSTACYGYEICFVEIQFRGIDLSREHLVAQFVGISISCILEQIL
jgi:hypothetical protein